MTDQAIAIKIAYIGGGSRGWAFAVMSDLALCPRLKGELVLYDIDRPAALNNVEIAKVIFSRDAAVGRFKVRAARTVADALIGADFVVASIEPGPMELRYADLEIPRQFGILQTVGDSVGPGGLMRALRAIPIKMQYAHEIMRHCPSAWVINYTNPMTLCTAAFYAAEPKIKAFGCCHEVFGTQDLLAGLVAQWHKVPKPARHEIRLDIAGVNHFTVASAASWNGIDLMPMLREHMNRRGFFRDRTRESRERIRKGEVFGSENLVKFDMLRNLGVLGAAGDRHLVENLPWYLTSVEALHRWGVIQTPYAWRIGGRAAPPPKPSDFAHRPLAPSGEEGIAQMLALLGVAPLDTNVNLPNRGQMPDAPLGAVVETYAQFRRDSVTPIVAASLPAGAAALQRRVMDVQEMTLDASIANDRDLAFAALLNDPLVRISPDKARRMLDAMLEYTRAMVPGMGS